MWTTLIRGLTRPCSGLANASRLIERANLLSGQRVSLEALLREADELAQSQYEKAEVDLAEERNKPACPESPERLFLEGVGCQQAARMLERPETEVHAQWVDFAAQDDLSVPEDATSNEALEDAIVDDGEWVSYSDDDLRELCKSESVSIRSNTTRKTMIAKLDSLPEKQAG